MTLGAMSIDNAKRITLLRTKEPDESELSPPNPARDVQNFVGKVMEAAYKPVDLANFGFAKLTQGLADALPAFPAARLFVDLVLGWPHSHPHPPTFGLPLPSIGPVICAGATNVLINGLPAARAGDVGFAAWCGGYYPLFEVFTGSSNVFIGGARAARQFIDFTKHCLPGVPGIKGVDAAKKGFKGLSALEKGMMALPLVMGALGATAALTDQANYQEEADSAESESDAKEAQALAEAAGTEAMMAGVQAAADIVAMALAIGMGKDPGITPFTCWGNFITGSPNVRIGGLPMPGWMSILRGLRKLLKRRALKIAPRKRQNNGCGRVGEPIDVVTGANVDDFIDFTLPDPRFVWRRWYDSQHQAGPLGWGFRHEYQHELRRGCDKSEYIYTDPEGDTVPFPPFFTDIPSERVEQSGYVLKRVAERRFELTMRNRPTIEFEFGEATETARMVALRDEDRNYGFDYDAQGRLIGIRLDEKRTVRLVYSPAGLVEEVRLEQARQDVVYVARYRYEDDCLIEFRDALGKTASYEYDGARRMTRKTDRRGYSYRYRYDERGRCVYTSGEDGMYELWLEYHPEERATLARYSDGGDWLYEYWEIGNLIKRDFIGEVSPDDPLLEGFPDVAAEIERLRRSRSMRDEQSAPQEKYDLVGRLIERRNADGSVERWEYDAEGNEVLYVDGDGREHRKEYASWNLLHREIDPAGNAHAFQYSPTEEVTRFVDAGGAIHDFVYDKKDRLVEVRRNGERYEVYRYDEADNLVEKLDGEGRSLFVCDPGYGGLDRVQRFANGEVYQFEYNERGLITRARMRRDRLAFDYDEEGRSTRDERNGLGVVNEFDGAELISTTIFKTFIARYQRRYGGRLIITDPTGGQHTIHIGENGLILKELANGTRELIQYDPEGRCLRKVLESGRGERHSRVYHYSAAGDLARVEDSRRGWIEYHYDAAHRLKYVEREDGRNELYYHDAAGNLTLQPGLDGVKVSVGNRLKQANGERFHYDHRDNVVLRASEKRTTRYEYDSFDQLIGMRLDGREWSAEYDALGRRVRKLWPGQTTEYYWDGDRLAAEVRADGSVRIYVYVDERALVPFLYVDYESFEAAPESGRVKYLFTNHLGAPERVEDESGRAIWQGEVSAYGMVAFEVGRHDEINLRFPGHYCDPETGLHYNRFRYYDPRIGRYLQCDPLGIAGGYNLYAYLANPLIGVDILGLAHKGQPGRSKGDGKGRGKPKRNVSKLKKLKKREVAGESGIIAGSFFGKTQQQILKAAPKTWKKLPSDRGNGWKLVDENGIERVRFMRPVKDVDPQWTRMKSGYWRRQNANGADLDEAGRVVPRTDPYFEEKTHITYSGVD